MCTYRYFAFISYQRSDEEYARWLHHQLETYRLPSNLKTEEPLPESLRPLFLDEEELSGGNLREEINHALDESRYLIVLCSPNSAKSVWVDKEVRRFIVKGRVDNVIPVIVSGQPYSGDEDECYVPALQELRGTDMEPLGINTRYGREMSSVKLVARMLSLRFDDLWQRYEREKEAEMQRLLREKRRLQRLESKYLAEKSMLMTSMGDSCLAQKLALSALPLDLSDPDRPYVRDAEVALRKAVSSRAIMFRGHKGRVRRVCFSPDGTMLASSSDDRSMRLWKVETGSEVYKVDQIGRAYSVAFSSDGREVAVASHSKKVIVWRNGNHKSMKCHKEAVMSAVFHPDGKSIMSSSLDGTVRVWNIVSGEESLTIRVGAEVRHASYSSDGEKILTISGDGFIRIWSAATGQPVVCWFGHEKGINTAVFSRDGSLIMTASDDGTIKIWHPNGRLVRTVSGHKGKVNSAEFSPDYQKVVSASEDGTVRIWGVVDGEEKYRFDMNGISISHAVFSPCGEKVAFATSDGHVYVRKVPSVQSRKHIFSGTDAKMCCLSTKGDRLLIAGRSGEIYRMDTRTFEMVSLTKEGDVHYIDFAGTDKFVTMSVSGKVYIRELKTGRVLNVVSDGCGLKDSRVSGQGLLIDEDVFSRQESIRYLNMCFNSSAGCLYYTSDGRNVNIYDVAGSRFLNRLVCESPKISKMCVSGDGKWMLTTSFNGLIRLWNIAEGQMRWQYKVDKGVSTCCLIGSNGDFVAVATDKGEIYVLSMDTGLLLRKIDAHRSAINHLDVSISGKCVLSSSRDKNISVWDVYSGMEIDCLKMNDNILTALFLSDGNRIVCSTSGGLITVETLKDVMASQDIINAVFERFKENPLTEKEKRIFDL